MKSAIMSVLTISVVPVTATTVLEHLLRCGISEHQARQHLDAGHVRINGVPATGVDAQLSVADDSSPEKPLMIIQPY
jgi:hypothetical protein